MTPLPLTDMSAGEEYKGQDGGLYGAGSNHPPADHRQAAMRAASGIRRLAPDGNPAESGLIGLLAIGFSNARDEFEEFVRLALADPESSPALCFVNGAQSHMGTSYWASGESAHGDPWRFLMDRLDRAGISPSQVQAVWIKTAPPLPAKLGEFPRHAEQTKRELHGVMSRLAGRFPNLRLAYLSSRIYAGYAITQLSPEPYAYEEAFAMRWLIQDQIRGDPTLSRVPLMLWGPYLWANGSAGRRIDDLRWTRDDFAADGTHPSPAGIHKVAQLLLRFFKTDPTAQSWFLRP